MPTNKAPAAQGRLELKVKDFGPIIEAKLDFRLPASARPALPACDVRVWLFEPE